MLNWLLNVVTPTEIKRIFFITTLFTFLVTRTGRQVNYQRLFRLCGNFTPTVESFSFPALFTNYIWKQSEIGELEETVIIKNQVSMDTILDATPIWLYYPGIDDDVMMVYRVVLMEYRDTRRIPTQVP